MQYVKRITEIENKLTEMGHMVISAKRKCFLLRRLNEECAVTAVVIRLTLKTIQEAIGLLVIIEAESVAVEGTFDL